MITEVYNPNPFENLPPIEEALRSLPDDLYGLRLFMEKLIEIENSLPLKPFTPQLDVIKSPRSMSLDEITERINIMKNQQKKYLPLIEIFEKYNLDSIKPEDIALDLEMGKVTVDAIQSIRSKINKIAFRTTLLSEMPRVGELSLNLYSGIKIYERNRKINTNETQTIVTQDSNETQTNVSQDSDIGGTSSNKEGTSSNKTWIYILVVIGFILVFLFMIKK